MCGFLLSTIQIDQKVNANVRNSIVLDDIGFLVAKNLTDLAAEFFYERVMIGTLDMAFPSNRETFQPIVTEGSVSKAIFDFDLLFLILRKKFQV